eukprot:TRINITY_DN49259_c0_g1_i1.p1 TRINITY_DN49259_c0_g1~~TRINITY_DN49259_c0_g1_i1.p1  ORF type:complete len:112 (+),score=26.76 TRINITY_DN49259_c0_g1_i1:165-500(+)
MIDIGSWGSICRIKKCVFDFLSILDLMDDEDRWDLMGRDIRLRSTFLYCDFNQVISNAPKEEKQPLIDLANKLFQSIEELDYAVQIRSISLTHDRYDDAALVLKEVMTLMP